MAKRKKRKSVTNTNAPSAVENSKKSGFSTQEEWAQHLPQWLRDVQTLAHRGDVKKAKELLDEEKIQQKLAQINDRSILYFTCHEIALLCFLIGLCEKALQYCYKALEIHEDVGVYNLLGLIYRSMHQTSMAIEKLTKAYQLNPEQTDVWNNLGLCLMKVGRGQESIDLLRKVISVEPKHKDAYQNLLFYLNYLSTVERSEIFEESKKWAATQVPTSMARQNHDNILDPNRKLRIGYISPDFKEHSVMFFFESLLLGHDRDNFEIYGYGNVQNIDCVTESAIEKFDFYHNIKGVDDDDVAELIESDKIDILVELAGNTIGNSLRVLARKPAPIQVSYLGYPNTTGMPQIDYRFTDDLVDPPGQQVYYTEKLISLPNGFLCYNPGQVQPTVTAQPASINDFITFGCFNNVSKLNPELMKLWVEILNKVPNSKLVLKFGGANDTRSNNCYLDKFEELGLANTRERVAISNYLPSPKHLELYNSVDIALDTYPYNGTTTTCQALLMGVPVISLMGQPHASRVGFDLLSRLDLQFFAAQTSEEYVNKAIALALKPEALVNIRATMRQRLAASPLCSYQLITKDIENAYRKMWQDYCETKIQEKWDNRSNSSQKTSFKISVKEGKTNRGVFYAIWGDSKKITDSLDRSIQSVNKYHPELPIHVERFENRNKINKTKICELSPYEVTAFLDNDTVILGSLDYGFEKAEQFGLACCINENPWARRYTDEKLYGDMIEYNSGVLFFTKKAKPVFDAWAEIFEDVDASLFHKTDGKLSFQPIGDQGSFALAIQRVGFNPFILPHNWNFRPMFHTHFFGPIKIWHGYNEIPEVLHDWNAEQSTENAVISYGDIKKQPDMAIL